MRRKASKSIRVGPGDEVVVRGQLPPSARLSRLFVFAREGEAPFSPYVYRVADKMKLGTDGQPQMMSPLVMRLSDRKREDQLAFIADIDGYIQVMQEIDTEKDPKAVVTLKRRVCPDLPFLARMQRHLTGIFTWNS